jgi:hypothetical protein
MYEGVHRRIIGGVHKEVKDTSVTYGLREMPVIGSTVLMAGFVEVMEKRRRRRITSSKSLVTSSIYCTVRGGKSLTSIG